MRVLCERTAVTPEQGGVAMCRWLPRLVAVVFRRTLRDGSSGCLVVVWP